MIAIFAPDRSLRYYRFWFWLGVFFTALIVLLSLSRPPSQVAAMFSDKLLHVVAYAGLMGWFAQLFRHRVARVLLCVGFVTLGVGIEFLQGMVPYRQFEYFDMLANASGVLLAWVLVFTPLGRVLFHIEKVATRITAG